jgi:hypothetical protein
LESRSKQFRIEQTRVIQSQRPTEGNNLGRIVYADFCAICCREGQLPDGKCGGCGKSPCIIEDQNKSDDCESNYHTVLVLSDPRGPINTIAKLSGYTKVSCMSVCLSIRLLTLLSVCLSVFLSVGLSLRKLRRVVEALQICRTTGVTAGSNHLQRR